MSDTANLQAYMTGIKDFPDDGLWAELQLVIADSPVSAAKLAYPLFDDERIALVVDGEDNTYSVERFERGDVLANDGRRVIRDMASLGLAGLHWEDEELCDGCDEYSEDVCPECNCCPECRDPECEACEAETE